MRFVRRSPPGDARTEGDAGHRHFAVGTLLQNAFGLIDIAVDDEPRAPREVEEEQHVAGGQRGDERFLGIDPGRVGPRRGDDVRARRSPERPRRRRTPIHARGCTGPWRSRRRPCGSSGSWRCRCSCSAHASPDQHGEHVAKYDRQQARRCPLSELVGCELHTRARIFAFVHLDGRARHQSCREDLQPPYSTMRASDARMNGARV